MKQSNNNKTRVKSLSTKQITHPIVKKSIKRHNDEQTLTIITNKISKEDKVAEIDHDIKNLFDNDDNDNYNDNDIYNDNEIHNTTENELQNELQGQIDKSEGEIVYITYEHPKNLFEDTEDEIEDESDYESKI